MSPAALRTYRAERLLERDFHALRTRVLAIVAARLRAAGAALDGADLEACYASAWQGLYGAIVRGEDVANPTGWLALVTYRRAIEELRSRRRCVDELDPGAAVEPDLAGALDDRARLRRMLEGMRCRLDAREREAAALCYLHGYSREEAARRMGISELRMRKLMDGRGRGRAGVAAKVGELAKAIDAGEFCGGQASLMRALAFGVLEPGGERHRIALAHVRDCPACRRHVASLRGLAAALPPVLTLPGAPHAGLAALAGGGAHGSAGGLGASAAAGGGAAGGGWALSGGLAAKLAAGCAIALGVGAGCVAIERSGGHRGGAPAAARTAPSAQRANRAAAASPPVPHAAATPRRKGVPVARGTAAIGASSREFTPEQPPQRAAVPQGRVARAASAGGGAPAEGRSPTDGGAAEREFAPG